MTTLTWARADALMRTTTLHVDGASPPVSAVGGTSPEALPIASLPQADAVRDAFATVGWTVNTGHDWSLSTGFDCGGVPASFSISFDLDHGRVRTWAVAAATVSAHGTHPLTTSEQDLLAAIFEFAETPFPSMSGLITLGRGLAYPDVDEHDWPQPFAHAAMDWNVIVPKPQGLRVEPVDPPVRTLLVGYHWHDITNPEARTTVITRAVDHLPKVLRALSDLQEQDPAAFTTAMGACIPELQLGTRLGELRTRPGSPSTPPSTSAPTGTGLGSGTILRSSGSKIGGVPTEPAHDPVTSSGPTPPTVEGGARFCGQCGTARSTGAKFCGQCGTPFAPAPATAPAPVGDAGATVMSNAAIADDELTEHTRGLLERSAVQGDTLAMVVLGHHAKTHDDPDGARRWFEMAANGGNVDAMVTLAGMAMEEDNTEAVAYWMRQAADGGNLAAMAWLGAQAFRAQDFTEARIWLQVPADAGSTDAQAVLGALERITGNLDRARALLTQAAEAGSAEAMHELGLCELDPNNDDGDEDTAVTWWQRAADLGNSESMRALGSLAWQHGEEEDAAEWFARGANAGNVDCMRAAAVLAGSEGDTRAQRHWNEQAAAAGHAQALNDVGYALVHEGRIDEGMAMLEASARQGVPWALATHSWQLLSSGDFARAVAFGDEVMDACVQFVWDNADDPEIGPYCPEQLANAESNLALCRLALGGDPHTAVDTWDRGAQVGHVESMFYPAIVAHRAGRGDEARRIAQALEGDTRDELLATLREGVSDGGPWFADWCRDGLTIMGQLGDPASGGCSACGAVTPPEARFCPECGTHMVAP